MAGDEPEFKIEKEWDINAVSRVWNNQLQQN